LHDPQIGTIMETGPGDHRSERGFTMATDLRIEAEDRIGVLGAMGNALGSAGINIDGFCAVGSGGRGWLHLLVEDATGARGALEAAGYTVAAEREALVVDAVTDEPGALGEIAAKLGGAGVNIEVAYLATDTRLVLVADDAERARSAL
jgi:hypothetical protein